MTKKKYTIMILPDETTKVRKYRVPKLIVRGTIIGVALLALGLGYLMTDYYGVKKMVSELERLRMETRQQQQQLVTFAKSIDDLQGEMNRLRQFDMKLRVMADLDGVIYPEQVMGIGGENPEPFNPLEAELSFQDQALLNNMSRGLDRLRTDVSIQERSFQELVEYLEDQKSLLASTPSIWPVKGWLTSDFGYRTSPFTGRREMHKGLDVATRTGTGVIAPADGLVVFSGREGGFGNMLLIDHGYGLVTRYGHLSNMEVKLGQKVKRGDLIARVGNTGRSTGPHLHYEVVVNGVSINPMRYILN
ncbi:MAG: peptidoglycan DD-metalloendopeptidase family protein [bacterium]|nr:MAG: peptidoglycan DD-metalloendopeptidase family protein [bacterium]